MAIQYRTSDLAKWGTGKGANLTPGEVDNNFWEFAQRLLELEENPPQAAEISNIEVVGTQMKIFLSNGDSYGPYTLPYVMFKSRGEWLAGAAYSFLDLVTVKEKGLYLVNKDHVADATFDPDRTIDGDDVYTLVFGESAYIYSFGFFYPMRPGQGIGDGSYMAAHLFAYSVLLPADLVGSIAKLRAAPTADLVFAIRDQDDTELGTLTFAAGVTDGVFAFSTDWTGDVGDFVYLAPPIAIDDTARDLIVTFVGTRIL